jgi:sugar-specific transcriptional regulator TrmB
MKIKPILKQISLSDSEISVFEACTNNFLRASEIAQIVKFKRTNIYAILESLLEKELIVEVPGTKVKKFTAVAPSRIYDYIEKQKLELESDSKKLDLALETLKAKTSIKTRANVEFFNGTEEVKKFYLRVNSNPGAENVRMISKFLRYSIFGDAIEKINAQKEKNYKQLGKKFVKRQSIVPDNEESKNIINYQSSRHKDYLETSDFRLVDFNHIPIDNHLYITKKEIAIFSVTEAETWAARFMDRSMINTFNGIFEALWAQGVKYPKI